MAFSYYQVSQNFWLAFSHGRFKMAVAGRTSGFFVSLAVATITFMLSELIRSTAAVMGVMLACLIAGTILNTMVASWESAKYLFMVNLELINYLQDAAPPIEGMSLGFSLVVLLLWGVAALTVSFVSFTRRDVF